MLRTLDRAGRRVVFVLVACWSGGASGADEAAKAPQLSAWLAELPARAASGRSVERLFLGTTLSFAAEAMASESLRKDLAAHVFPQIVAESPWRFAVSLNRGAAGLDRRFAQDPSAIAVLSRSGLVLIADGKTCQLADRKQAVVREACNKEQGKQLAAWLTQKMGYNALVLAQKQRYLLIEGPTAALANGSQAFFFADSSEAERLPPDDRRVGALLQKIEGNGRYGIFAMVLTGRPKDVLPGTKVIVDDP